jgi:hypothetical protein
MLNDHAETAVLPAHLRPDRSDVLAEAAAEEQGCYQEYVRSLDEVPVLVDVAREPPRVVVKDFRLGQRRDVRKEPREDVTQLREEHVRDVERQYAEYLEICAGLVGSKRRGPRKSAGPKKQRAKRAKRSARSKS